MSTVFASRWKALWWSAMVLLTAYCSVPSAEETGTVATDPRQAANDPWVGDEPTFANDKNLRALEALRRELP